MADPIDKVVSFFHSWHWSTEKYPALGAFIRGMVEHPERLNQEGKNIWDSNNKTVELCQVPEEAGTFRIALKRSGEQRFWRYFLRPSLALREYYGFREATRLGMPCVEVLACGENRNGFRLKESYFVTRFAEDTYQMQEYEFDYPRHEAHAEMLALLSELMTQIARLHAAGFRHGGAHGRNFLCRKQPDGKIEILWIDLATLRRFSRRKRWKEILLDLSDLLEYFDLSKDELAQLQEIYFGITGFPVRFEKYDGPRRKRNRCVMA